MEKDKRLGKKIGTKTSILPPKDVVVQEVKIEQAKTKEGKEVGDKVVFVCNYPDKNEPVNIGQVIYERGNKMEYSGLWYKEDEDGNIPKDSALAHLMRFVDVQTLEDFKGKTLSTVQGDRGFLVLKAY